MAGQGSKLAGIEQHPKFFSSATLCAPSTSKMIPSRGLRWMSQPKTLSRQRLEASSARQFSSSVHNTPSRRSPHSVQIQSSLSSRTPRTGIPVRSSSGIRFASTTPLTTPLTTIAPATTTVSSVPVTSTGAQDAASPSLNSLADTSLTSIVTDFHQITEKIGFLKELGLDYGNGPTAVMEWVLEHIHVYAGTPWWISIGLTALAVRVALFKPYMDASDVSARMSSVKDITAPIQKQMTVRGNPDAALKARLELQMIYKRAGIRPWKVFVPMLQVFTGYGMWNLLRGMSSLPVPGLEDGGALWFYNLTIPDPLFLLPAATSGLLYYTLKKGGETGSTTMSPQATRIMSVAFPAVSFLFTFWLPASVQLSFAATSGLSWIQMRLFQSARVRDSFGMYPLPQRKQVPASASPYKGTMRAPLTQAELDRKYEAATTQGAGFKAMVGRKMDEMTHTVKSVTSQGKDYLGQGKEKIAERLQKEELKDAQKYEERRKRELAEETEAKKKIASRRARRVESKMTRR